MTTKRIEGWKSIAGYLGRDRSTVIRWARERGLPVHALPGGKSRSVYALHHELDAWASGQANRPSDPADAIASAIPDDVPAIPASTVPAPASAPAPGTGDTAAAADAPRRWRRQIAAAALLVLVGGGALTVGVTRHTTPAEAAILDRATMARYVAARDDIATRAAARLDAAIRTLSAIARDHPGHAGTHEAMAEAWLLAREFGSAPDAIAIPRARRAAALAGRIDPDSVVADRVEGVIAYWWDRDPVRAGTLFRRAIGHDPQDALAHLWYANILADNGEHAAAAREFDAARLLAPGAPWLLADYGWGLWSAGRTVEAQILLTGLAAEQPRLASVQDCLSVTALARGDLPGYVHHLRMRVRLRGEPELAAYATALDRTVAVDATVGRGHGAAYALMLSRAISYTQNAERPDHSWPAFVASIAGDRAQLLAILHDARTRDERWGAAGYVHRIRQRWANDGMIVAALDMLAQPRIESA